MQKYKLVNLDCANCAIDIENEVKKINEVKDARVDFLNLDLYVEANKDIDFKLIKTAVLKVKNSVKIYEENDAHIHDSHPNSIFSIGILLLGVVLLVLAFLGEKNYLLSIRLPFVIILYVISYLLIGYKVIINAFRNLFKGKALDENVLMFIATLGAFSIGEYIEAVAVMLFYMIGEMFQDFAVDKSRKRIKSLVDLKPPFAHLIKNGEIIKVEPETLNVGDKIIVKPGEKIPVDGLITKGSSTLNMHMITGEATPVDKTINEKVISGSINLTAQIEIEVLKLYEDSTVSKIINFVEQNATKKAKTERFITRFSKIYTPVVVLIAILVAFLVPVMMMFINKTSYQVEFLIYFKRALIFLVISCPCALVLSVPLSYYAGVGLVSKHGILVKSGSDLEAFLNVEAYVFDKTGTLTTGIFEIDKISGSNKEELIKLAATIESISNHPIAKQIVKYYGKTIEHDKLKDATEIFGHGIVGYYEGKELLAGNEKLLSKYNVSYEKAFEIGTVVYVAYDKKYLGYILLKDTIKDEAYQIVKLLKDANKKIYLISGDNEEITTEVGNKLGIKHIYHSTLPEDKQKIIKDLKREYHVAFIGDGINDSLALIESNLGISMGNSGSDLAIEASDVVVMNDDVNKLSDAYKISKFTKRIVIGNIVFALSVKIIVLILGLFGIANMALAIFADVGVSILAVLNSLRILRYKV